MRDHLQLIPGVKLNSMTDSISKSAWAVKACTAEIDFSPMWNPDKVLQASELSLMQAETLYFVSGNTKAKDNNHKDGKLL